MVQLFFEKNKTITTSMSATSKHEYRMKLFIFTSIDEIYVAWLFWLVTLFLYIVPVSSRSCLQQPILRQSHILRGRIIEASSVALILVFPYAILKAISLRGAYT